MKQPQPGEVFAVLSRGVVMVSSVLVGVVAARQLGPAGRGQLAVIQSAVMLVAPLFCLTLAHANLYFAAKEPARLGALVANSLGLLLVNLILLSGIALVWGSQELTRPTAIWLWCHMVLMLSLTLAMGKGWIQRVNLTEIAVNLVWLAGLGWAVWSQRLSLHFVVYLRAAASVLGGFALLLGLGGNATDALRPDRPLLKSCWSYGLPITVASFLSVALANVNQVSVAWLNGDDAAGLFAVASQGGALLLFLPTSFIGVFMHRFVAMADNLSRLQEMHRLLPFWAGFLLLMSLVAGGTSFWWMTAVFGEPYRSCVPIFLWLLPGFWCLGVQQMACVVISSSQVRPAYLVLASAAVGLNLVLNILLADHGPLGGAWAFTVTQILFLIMSLVYFRAAMRA